MKSEFTRDSLFFRLHAGRDCRCVTLWNHRPDGDRWRPRVRAPFDGASVIDEVIRPIREQTRGYVLVVVTATFWGFSGNLAKYLVNGAIDPLALTQARSLLAAAVLLVFLLGTRPSVLRLARTTLLWTAGFGLSLAATQVFYFSAIERLNVAAGILLEYLAPAIVVIQAYDPAALSLSAAGVIFGVGAAIAFAAYILVGEHLQKLSPFRRLQRLYCRAMHRAAGERLGATCGLSANDTTGHPGPTHHGGLPGSHPGRSRRGCIVLSPAIALVGRTRTLARGGRIHDGHRRVGGDGP